MGRRRRILPNDSLQLPGKGLNHQAKMDVSPCSSHQTAPLNEQDHQSKPLVMPYLNQNQTKIKVLPHLGHKNTSAPSSCFKHQATATQLSHAENQTVPVPFPHLDHPSPIKPIATQSPRPRHWARSTIPSLPFPDSGARTAGTRALPYSENGTAPPLNPDLWNKTSLDPEHLPRIPQGFDHWAENQHLNYWPTISLSSHYQNEVTSHTDCRPRVKTVASLSFDYWVKATASPFLSYSHQSKALQALKHYERDIISPLPLQTFSHQHRAKGIPLPCPDCPEASGEPARYHKASPLPDADQMTDKDRVKSRPNFNQCVKAPDLKHCVTYPLESKDSEMETKLVPAHQVSLPPGPEQRTKVLPDSDRMCTKILPDPEYQTKFPLDSINHAEASLGPIYQSNDELGPDQKAKFLLAPIHHVQSALDADQCQVEGKTDLTLQVHFVSGPEHKVTVTQGADYYVKYEARPKQLDEISSGSDFQMTTPDPDKRIKVPLNFTNCVTFPLYKHKNTSSQNPNNQTAPYLGLDQQPTFPLGNRKVTSSALKQRIKPSQTPKYWATHLACPKHPDMPSQELDHQQTCPLSFKHGQINPPSFDEQLETPKDPIRSAQGHSYPEHCAKVLPHPDKQVKAISVPKYRTNTIKNRESSWCFNYIRPYIVEGGAVHKRTVNNIINSIPQEEIKNDIRKQILLKRMKEYTVFQDGPRLCSSYVVCVLCASWIPYGCPHVDKMHGQTVAQLLAIPTPVPGSNTRMGIRFILQLPPQRTSPHSYLPFPNFGRPSHTYYSPVIPSPSFSEPMPPDTLLVSWLNYSHDKYHQSPGRKPTGSPVLFPRKMSERKEESVESAGIFKSFLERYQMKKREN
ncbi:uncharacterized protein [Notamacropus eugenii]|uniref:uncharacterized protein n=1 Tax=Notamacropus eugenii TaxID=9315 RepID=UPI003B683890